MNYKLEKSYQHFIETKKRFVDKNANKTAEQQSFKSSEDEWSMLEVMEHILISEGGILKLFEKYPPLESTYKMSLKSKATNFMLSKLYKSSKKVKLPMKSLAPKGNQPFGEMLQQSNGYNEAFLAHIKGFPDDKMKLSVFKHPVSGGMTMENTIDFLSDHIVHHLHQLDRIIAHHQYPK